jgi:DNA-binding CsgD family transcriptional regulator
MPSLQEPMALVLVADPDVTPIPPKEMLAQLFGFTAAEMRVAERLLMGDSPEQAAAFLHGKTATARWHLASIYRKTATNRRGTGAAGAVAGDDVNDRRVNHFGLSEGASSPFRKNISVYQKQKSDYMISIPSHPEGR